MADTVKKLDSPTKAAINIWATNWIPSIAAAGAAGYALEKGKFPFRSKVFRNLVHAAKPEVAATISPKARLYGAIARGAIPLTAGAGASLLGSLANTGITLSAEKQLRKHASRIPEHFLTAATEAASTIPFGAGLIGMHAALHKNKGTSNRKLAIQDLGAQAFTTGVLLGTALPAILAFKKHARFPKVVKVR